MGRSWIVTLSVLGWTLAVWALTTTLSPSIVGAQIDAEEPRLRFEAGRRAYAEGRYEQALEDFREAYRQSGHPEMLSNIGEAAERLELHREALEAYEQYVAAMAAAGRDITNRARVENRMRALRARLGREDPPPTTDDPPAGADLALVVAGIALEAVGVAAVAIGIAGLVIREDAATTYNGESCDPTLEAPSSEARCGDVRAEGESWGTAGGVLLGIGAAAVIGGAVLLGMGVTTSTESGVAVRCAPSVGGIVCDGRF